MSCIVGLRAGASVPGAIVDKDTMCGTTLPEVAFRESMVGKLTLMSHAASTWPGCAASWVPPLLAPLRTWIRRWRKLRASRSPAHSTSRVSTQGWAPTTAKSATHSRAAYNACGPAFNGSNRRAPCQSGAMRPRVGTRVQSAMGAALDSSEVSSAHFTSTYGWNPSDSTRSCGPPLPRPSKFAAVYTDTATWLAS